MAQEKLARCNECVTNHDDEEILNEATKPEVVITMCEYKIEIQFWRLDIDFRLRQSPWNIDRHEVLHSSPGILLIWNYVYYKTGNRIHAEVYRT